MRRLGLVTAIATSCLTLPASASASETKEFPVTMDWRIGQLKAHTCTSWGLATWKAQKGATAWQIIAQFNGKERRVRVSKPFHDATFTKYGWRPGKGKHWHGLSYSGRSHGGGKPVSCGDLQAKQKALYGKVVIRITIPDSAKIVGKVTGPGGVPVEGVRVRAGGAGSDRTDAKGAYEIDVPERTRTYTVRPSRSGAKFRPSKRRVRVKAGQVRRANFRMKGYVISGRIKQKCDGGSSCVNNPIGGARVTAKRSGRTALATTAADGDYALVVPRKGTWRVVPTGKGMAMSPSRRTVKVRSSRVRGKDFDACANARSTSLRSPLATAAQSGETTFSGTRALGACTTTVTAHWANTTIARFVVEGSAMCQVGDTDQGLRYPPITFSRPPASPPAPYQGMTRTRMLVDGDIDGPGASLLTGGSEVWAQYSPAPSPPAEINVYSVFVQLVLTPKDGTFDRFKCTGGWERSPFLIKP